MLFSELGNNLEAARYHAQCGYAMENMLIWQRVDLRRRQAESIGVPSGFETQARHPSFQRLMK